MNPIEFPVLKGEATMNESLRLALESAQMQEEVILAAGCVHARDSMRQKLVSMGATPEDLRRIKFHIVGQKVGEI